MKNRILMIFLCMILVSAIGYSVSFTSPTVTQGTSAAVTFTTDCSANSTIWVDPSTTPTQSTPDLFNSGLNSILVNLPSYNTYNYQALCSQGYDPTNYQGLVAYYELGKDTINTSSLVVTDSSGNSNNGAIQGVNYSHGQLFNGTINSTYGKYGNGWSNDGNNSYISVPYSQTFNFTNSNAFSVSLWINPLNFTDTISNEYLFSISQSAPTIQLQNSTRKYRWYVNDSAGALETSSVVYNQWIMLTLVYNGTHILAYENNNLAGTKQTGYMPTTQVFNIGKFTTQRFYNGSIDSFLIFNRALSPTEITTLYNSQTSYSPITDGLVLQYAFENGNATHTYDEKTIGVGKYNEGMGFDGNRSYISLPINILKQNQSSTFGAWFKSNLASQGAIVSTLYGSGILGRAGSITYGGAILECVTPYNTTATAVIDYTIALNGVWHNTMCSIDLVNNISILYLDGQNVGNISNGGSSPPINNNGKIGARAEGGTPIYFNGSIDEVMIFNRSLSQNEIVALYNFQNKNYAFSGVGSYLYYSATSFNNNTPQNQNELTLMVLLTLVIILGIVYSIMNGRVDLLIAFLGAFIVILIMKSVLGV